LGLNLSTVHGPSCGPLYVSADRVQHPLAEGPGPPGWPCLVGAAAGHREGL